MLRNITSLLLCLFLFSCSDLQDAAKSIEKVNKNQDLIINKLNALDKKIASLDKKVGQGAAANKPNKKNDKPKADPNKVYDIAEAGSIVLGNPDAKVSIVKWTDYQWPYCAKSVGLVDEILEKYPNDVKVIVKNFPLSFHKQARRAAQYALAADRQGKFKEMYHAIFEEYRKLKANEDLPLEIAQRLGLDMEKFKSDANDPEIDAQIQKEFDQMRNSGIPRLSVPKFLVAGKEPQGRDLATFSRMIDEALKK